MKGAFTVRIVVKVGSVLMSIPVDTEQDITTENGYMYFTSNGELYTVRTAIIVRIEGRA